MTRRTDRVADALQGLIAELLLREIKDPRIGLVTITGVRVSPDLRHARVFFSTLGDADTHEQALAGLRSAAGFMRSVARSLGKSIVEFKKGMSDLENEVKTSVYSEPQGRVGYSDQSEPAGPRFEPPKA